MSVFSGVVPVVTGFANSNLNVAAKGLLDNLAVTGARAGLGIAVSPQLGAQIANQLGIGPTGGSNFLSQIVTPGLISTGVNGLSQTLATSLKNSKALGPFGPLAGNLVDAGLNFAGRKLTEALGIKGLGSESKGTLYFPGAGGSGEGEANFPNSITYPGKKNLHSISSSSGDIVFSLVPVKDLAQIEAYDQTLNTPTPPQGTQPQPASPPAGSSATTSGTPETGGVPSGAPAAPAAPAQSASAASAPSQAPLGSEQYFRERGGVPQTPTSPSGVNKAANEALATQSTGTGTGEPLPGTANGATPSTGTGQNPPAQEQKDKPPEVESWKFICPPEEISWETTFQADRVPIFGMNEAPVIGGVKSMRDLTLSNAIVEGFTRGKTIEDTIAALENGLNMSRYPLPSGESFINIPVYRVYAGGKFYGKGIIGEGGYFVLKSVRVQEKMRDFSGRATRALVDISLIQVPSYQVNTGRDISSPFLPSQKSVAGVVAERVLANSPQLAKDVSAAADQKVGSQRGGGGAGGGGSTGTGSAGQPPTALNPRNDTGPSTPQGAPLR